MIILPSHPQISLACPRPALIATVGFSVLRIVLVPIGFQASINTALGVQEVKAGSGSQGPAKMDEPSGTIDAHGFDKTRYKITFTFPGSAIPSFMPRISLLKQETRSQIVEAASIEEAERMAADERLSYPVNWSVSVEELLE